MIGNFMVSDTEQVLMEKIKVSDRERVLELAKIYDRNNRTKIYDKVKGIFAKADSVDPLLLEKTVKFLNIKRTFNEQETADLFQLVRDMDALRKGMTTLTVEGVA